MSLQSLCDCGFIFVILHFSLPEGLEDVTKFPDLVAELLRRKYTEDEVKKVVGENLIRVFEKAEKVSACLFFLISSFSGCQVFLGDHFIGL